MSLGQKLAPHLSLLRRYARALTGSQNSGDAYVRATLQSIIASPDEFPAQVERLRGDRDQGVNGLKSLAGQSWDVCVDVSGYTARQVRASGESITPSAPACADRASHRRCRP